VLPICNVFIQVPKPLRGYPKEEDIRLGAALKHRRLDLGLTQAKVANLLDLVCANYQRFERNIHLPQIRKRKEINKFLGYNFWEDNSKSLANKTLLYRIEHKLSATEFGNKIGVSRNTIKRLENGIRISQKMTGIIYGFLTIS
jgi:transcriptional regulator with XRE-family HTH domain